MIESEAALIFPAVKEHFEEGEDANLLLQVGHLLHNCWEALDEIRVSLHSCGEFCDLTAAERHEHIVEPLEVATDETAQDLLIELQPKKKVLDT